MKNYTTHKKQKFKGHIVYGGHLNIYEECEFESSCTFIGGMPKFINCKFGRKCIFLCYSPTFVNCEFGDACYFDGYRRGTYSFEGECNFGSDTTFINCGFEKECIFGKNCHFSFTSNHGGIFNPNIPHQGK